MEFGLREVLILVGLVVIAGILFDGYRRMRKSKQGGLDMPSAVIGSNESEWDVCKSELPNGGARRIPLSVRNSIAEGVTHHEEDADIDENFGSALDEQEPVEVLAVQVKQPQIEVSEPDVQTSLQENNTETQTDLFADDEQLASLKAEQQAKLNKHTGSHKKAQPAPEPEWANELQEVFVINVMAKNNQELKGADLLRVLLSCGFRFGEMNIFHRYEQHSGKGSLLFSVANVVEPGVFDLDSMDNFSTPGICMFMKLPGPKRPIHAFDILMDSARKIANLLDADIKDEHHNIMRQQTAEHYRQRVLDFERKYLSYKAGQKQL